MTDPVRPRAAAPSSVPRNGALRRHWRKVFLQELAATSNVTASARAAGISTTRAYEVRRADAVFYREWQEALCEGYDHLEMSLLQRLREGEVKPASGAKRGIRVFDNATAFRLLIAHRESAARQRAIIENRNSASIVDAINAKIEKIRLSRRAAAQSVPSQSVPSQSVVVQSVAAPALAAPTLGAERSDDAGE